MKVDTWLNEATQKKEPISLQTIICGEQAQTFRHTGSEKPVLVILHGYGGSGSVFYNVLEYLTKHFTVIFVDLTGMGGSSRTNDIDVTKMTAESFVDYFVGHLEKWREKLKLTDFYFACHSFGGFIGSHFALRNHKHIKKLVLMSPVGLRVPPSDETPEQRFEDACEACIAAGVDPPDARFGAFMKMLWNTQVSMLTVTRFLGRVTAKKLIAQYVDAQVPDPAVNQVMKDYLYHLFMRPSNTECGIQVCFTHALQCKLPVGERLINEFPKPLAVIMGEKDWMTPCEEGWSKRVIDERKLDESYMLTPDAGH